MTSSLNSSLEDINSALQNQNPFSQPPFVNANNVWGKNFPDVETLNAHASDAVFQALEQIRAGHYSTTSILITAQNGTGKTHIISRIRHRLQVQGGALFVFANKYGDLNQIKSGFQQILADSLRNIGSQGVMQWQEVATAMANQALKVAVPQIQVFTPKNLVKKFQSWSQEQVNKWVNQLPAAFCKTKDVSDPDIVRAIFWTLSDEQALYAVNWLAGKELSQYKANELRLPNQRQSFDAVLQILDLISEYNELVICFDELDSPEFSDAGLHKSQVVAGLVKELFENLNRGVILTVMMPGTWNERVKKLPGGVWSKMSAQGNPLDLKYLDGDSIIELVTFSLKEYYEAKGLVPPHPIYPFDENQLRDIGKEKPTVREVLQWCRDNCKPPIPGVIINPPETSDPVELAFTKELEEDFAGYLDNNFLLADALLFGFQTLIGQTVERVTIQQVTDKVKKRGGKDQYLNLKVIGKEDGKDVSIGVAVLQYDGGRALGAGLKRLIDENGAFSLTRGCLVRSQHKKLNSHFKKTYLEPLINQKGGEFVDLKEEEIKPLIAIRAVYQKREVDYGLSEEQIYQFIAQKGIEKKLGASNPLLTEILSDPSYQIPVIEEEPEASDESTITDKPEASEASGLAELIGNE
jgi:hypothetical protein